MHRQDDHTYYMTVVLFLEKGNTDQIQAYQPLLPITMIFLHTLGSPIGYTQVYRRRLALLSL